MKILTLGLTRKILGENMTDQEILEKYVDLSDSDLNAAEKKSLYKVLLKYKEAFSLRDEDRFYVLIWR